MERILLINPAQIFYKKTTRRSVYGSIGLPLGLLYIASILESKNCHIQIIDSLISEEARFIKNKDAVYFGIPPSILKEKIKAYKPDIVGITNTFTSQEEPFLQTADLVKEVYDSALLIVGGANVSCRGRYMMENSSIDIAVKGEGEEVVSDIIDFYRGKKKIEEIKGIFYRQNGRIFETEPTSYIKNLDKLPYPAYHLLNLEDYLSLYKRGIYVRSGGVRRNLSMITSRGCPYNCVFCSIFLSMGKFWRAHSAEYVKEHIEMLSKKYNVRHIHFEDDNLIYDIERFDRILDVLGKEKITWDTPNGIRVDLRISRDMLLKMKKCGCRSLTIGVESGDEYVLNKIIKKNLRLADVEEFAKRCKDVGIELIAFFVLGFPGETRQSMQKTIEFAMYLFRRYNVRPANLIATPLFGTELYRICKEKGYFSKEITPKTLSESITPDSYSLISTEQFSAKDVEGFSRSFTSRIYIRLLFKLLRNPYLLVRKVREVGNLFWLKRLFLRLIYF